MTLLRISSRQEMFGNLAQTSNKEYATWSQSQQPLFILNNTKAQVYFTEINFVKFWCLLKQVI